MPRAKPREAPPEAEILTTLELAEFLKCSRTTVHQMAKKGQLPGFKIGHDWRFELAAVIRWIAEAEERERRRRRQ